MKRAVILIILPLLMLPLTAHGGTPDERLSTPEKTLETYIGALREGNPGIVHRCYYSVNRDFRFHLPHPIRIDGYTVTKKTIYTDKIAKKYESIPRAEVGDVELEVRESIEGQEEMFTYLLRRIDREWRIISHAGWNQPD
jgi:hypothetical protein